LGQEYQMQKNNNDKKILNYQIKKWSIILLYIVIIILEMLALCGVIDMLWGCVLFIIVLLLKKVF